MSTGSREVFESAEFDDETIRKQLVSLDHQVVLQDHGEWIESLGPCTVTLARALAPARSRDQAAKLVAEYFREGPGTRLDKALSDVFANHPLGVLRALRTVAESYLARTGRALPSWGDGSVVSSVPDVVLRGESGAVYIPKLYLARGSAGLVYGAEVEGQATRRVALKRVYPTQIDSALNEYKIATRIRGSKSCLSYEDIVKGPGESEVWLVLPLIERSDEFGVDLREYIVKGFFQKPGHDVVARHIAIQLLQGLSDVSKTGVIMRDVKPDNVLIQSSKDGKYDAFWTDFGLAVDLGEQLDGNGLRRVTTSDQSDSDVESHLVGWWYDTCKLVPRPKWLARRPPERAFTAPAAEGGGPHSFDIYMVGIIFVCMAIGVDIPHLDQAEAKKAFELVFGKELPADYLRTFELGEALRQRGEPFKKSFETTFGDAFGSQLFDSTVQMLSIKPTDRPSPDAILAKIGNNV